VLKVRETSADVSEGIPYLSERFSPSRTIDYNRRIDATTGAHN
jgi:hypothetical protein